MVYDPTNIIYFNDKRLARGCYGRLNLKDEISGIPSTLNKVGFRLKVRNNDLYNLEVAIYKLLFPRPVQVAHASKDSANTV